MIIEDLKEKGCVYFFKHIGLDPVKIGYSKHTSPYKRFEQFKTYAPFGAELVGFIICNNPKELETFLHQKYMSKRLDGEWFNISIKDVEKEIEINTEKEIIYFKNQIQIKLAEEINKLTSIKNNTSTTIENNKEVFNKKHFLEAFKNNDPKSLNKSRLAKLYNVSRTSIINWSKEL